MAKSSASTLTVDDDPEARVLPVPPDSMDDYEAAANKLQPGYLRTQDDGDSTVGWTSQHLTQERGRIAAPSVLDETPGQVFGVHQLPDPQMAKNAGFQPQQIPRTLVVEDPSTHPQGLELSETATLGARDDIRAAAQKQIADAQADALAQRESILAPRTTSTSTNASGSSDASSAP